MAMLLLLAATALTPPAAEVVVLGETRPALAARPLPDAVLATMRGGFRLPNGLDLSLGIDIQTRVDGVLAVHTVYANEGPNAGVRVFTGGGAMPGQVAPGQVAPGSTSVVVNGAQGAPSLSVDRSPTGVSITPGSAAAPTTVNLTSGPLADPVATGEQPVALVANGPRAETPAGAVSLSSDPNGAIVTLRAAGLEVRQLIGQATGVVVANSANNRTIDTVSSLNVGLRGLSPAVMAGTFNTERAMLESHVGR